MPRFMDACEFQLYKWVLGGIPEGAAVMGHVAKALGGMNELYFHNVKVQCLATRMSGDMNTSLGNGFSNLMIMMFLASEAGIQIDGVVEGDDGLFVATTDARRLSSNAEVTFASLGFEVKVETCDSMEQSGFCRQFNYEKPDGSWGLIIDAISAVAKFGWSFSAERMSRKAGVVKGLLRSKSLSLHYQAPSCPVVWALARRYIHLTSGASDIIDSTDRWWELEKRKRWDGPAEPQPPCLAARYAMERTFGISITDQLALEQYFSQVKYGETLCHPVLFKLCAEHKDWATMWSMAVEVA
jgi:hypothetical protein